jgi:hypothetical protein
MVRAADLDRYPLTQAARRHPHARMDFQPGVGSLLGAYAGAGAFFRFVRVESFFTSSPPNCAQ